MRIRMLRPQDTAAGFLEKKRIYDVPPPIAEPLIKRSVAVKVGWQERQIKPDGPDRTKPKKPEQANYYAEQGNGSWWIIRDSKGNEVEKVNGQQNMQARLEELHGA